MSVYLYVLAANPMFPEPGAEFRELHGVENGGGIPYLLLAARPAPPLSAAAAGDEVVFCRRENQALTRYGHAAIAGRGALHPRTPPVVLGIYGAVADRWFVPLRGVTVEEPGPVGPELLTAQELQAFLQGQAYVKRVR